MAILDFLRLRTITHSDGLLECRVPRGWAEELEEDGTQVLWDPASISGTLRISVITAKRDSGPVGNPAIFLLGDSSEKPQPVPLANGNGFRHYRRQSVEDGEELAIHWFEVGNYVPPIYYRMALFSFTIKVAEEAMPETQRQLSTLVKEIPACQFLAEVQLWEQ